MMVGGVTGYCYREQHCLARLVAGRHASKFYRAFLRAAERTGEASARAGENMEPAVAQDFVVVQVPHVFRPVSALQ